MKTIQQYFDERKWCQVISLLSEMLLEDSASVIDFLTKNRSVLVNRSHPGSLSNLITKVIDLTQDTDFLTRICDEYKNVELPTEEMCEAEMIARINLDILNIKIIGGRIYEYQNIATSQKQNHRLFKLFYLYHEHANNITEAYFYLKKYIEVNKNDNVVELSNKLAYFALKSEDIFYFWDISEYVAQSDLKELVCAFEDGNLDFLRANCKDFSVDKAYMISILNLCHNQSKISFDTISTRLGVNEADVIRLVLGVLGKKLIRGYIDGESKEFCLFGQIPKKVNDIEIGEMKDKFEVWKGRIENIIEAL